MVGGFVCWLFGGLVGWLFGCWVGWLFGGGLFGWLVGVLIVWLGGGLAGWLVVDYLVGWSVARLFTHKFGSVKMTTQSHPVHKLRMSDSVPPLPNLSPRHAQGQLHLHGPQLSVTKRSVIMKFTSSYCP